MISNNKTFNEEPAAATDHGGLRFVFTTTLRPQQKDETYAFYHRDRA